MRAEIYKGYEIRSTPKKLINQGREKYCVNGIIVVNTRSSITEIMSENLCIPDDEYKHFNEDDADNIFIKYAKKYIDKML